MLYFSYNDFMDCTENGEIDKVKKVEENIEIYEVKNKRESTNKIIKILKQKIELEEFLKEFFYNLEEEDIENISYCENIKIEKNKNSKNNIICKIDNKEIYIFIKVIKEVDNNISYKMLESSLEIIKEWKTEEIESRRYPIVIPIVIYIGQEDWKRNNKNRMDEKINYITFEEYKINFSYNMININDLKIEELEKMKSNVAKELLDIKNKYLQIN